MKLTEALEENFRSAVLLACGVYLLIEAVYAVRLPLAMDEFQGAYTAHHLRDLVPYRDFAPYKTVLGYYVQLPTLLIAPGVWTGFLLTRGWMALLTAIVLYVSALRLSRHYRKTAVCLGLFLLVTMSTFLERSAVVRVDMMTSLCGLGSLLLLLDRRLAMAGALAALGFLVSQKGIYYLLAANFALATHACFGRRSRETVLRIAAFNLPAIAVGAAYFGVWWAASSFDAVWKATFVAPRDIVLRDLYSLHHYWIQTLFRNPYFYGVGFLSLGVLAARRSSERAGDRDWTLWAYGAALLGLSLWHKQPWPYFFVLLIPTLFVLAVSYFDFELERSEPRGLGRAWVAIYLALGIFYPLTRLTATLPRDSSFQRNTVEVAASLLPPGERYLAGVNLIYSRRQSLGELSWLDARRLTRLRALPPEELQELIARLDSEAPKVVIDNYRLRGLPGPLRSYLNAHYQPLWGNVQIYSPLILPSMARFRVHFEGDYLVQGRPDADIRIDGMTLVGSSRVRLSKGIHTNSSDQAFRIRVLADLPASLREPEYREARPLFPDTYGY